MSVQEFVTGTRLTIVRPLAEGYLNNSPDGLCWLLNLVATGIGPSHFIIIWEVCDACTLIVDSGNELHYCSQTQKYCMTNIPLNTVTQIKLTICYMASRRVHCVSLCLKN